ncbi:MAG TPA: agmatinase family protein [Chthoniobacterales bacterium]
MNFVDQNWPRASQWLSNGKSGHNPISLGVIGVPMNCSITPGRTDLAPAAIRDALARYSLFDEDASVDLSRMRAKDLGDVVLVGNSAEGNFFRCVDLIKRMQVETGQTVLLGGDNAVTRPGVHALGVPLERTGLLTFDAHHDLRDLEHGLTNGNPVRALLRDGLPGENVVQIGIQSFANSPEYARVARECGITVVTADRVFEFGIETVVTHALAHLSERADAIYVDLDVDVLDRAFAPGCPGARPGGLLPWMMRKAARVCGRHEKVRIMDLVEVDPSKDIADVTTLAAASFLLAFASGIASRSHT